MEFHKPEVGELQKLLENNMFMGTSREHVGDCAGEPSYPLSLLGFALGFPGQHWEVVVSGPSIDNMAVNTHVVESVPNKCVFSDHLAELKHLSHLYGLKIVSNST